MAPWSCPIALALPTALLRLSFLANIGARSRSPPWFASAAAWSDVRLTPAEPGATIFPTISSQKPREKASRYQLTQPWATLHQRLLRNSP